jgi:DNA polymerase-3 subunit epsilon
MQALQQLLSPDESLVVTDTETTGLHARVNRIIEIAAQRVTPTDSSEWFSELINPGVSIPGRITRITGISSSMVFGKPTAEVVMPDYRGFLGDGIFVAHNIRFDTSFINAEFERAGLGDMENPGICSLALARRLLPGLRSKGLGSLARFFRIPSEGRHRASKDVEITTLVLERLAQIAIDEHKISDIHELLSLQSKTYSKVNPFSKHVIAIRRDVLPEVPDTPGVYHMKDGRGKVLYVGKAKVLTKRVSSYFTAIEAHPPRLRQLIAKVRQIEWQETETELHALVTESRQIKEIDPPFNRAQKKYIPRPYLRIGGADPYSALTVQVIVRDDGASYYGPLRSRGQARTLVEIVEKYFKLRNCSSTEFSQGKRCVRADIGRCDAPCEGGAAEAAYESVKDSVKAFLEGDIGLICELITLDMVRASEKYAFEDAATYRDWLELLDSRVRQNGTVATPVAGPPVIHLCLASDKEKGTFVLVDRGQVTSIEAIDERESVEELATRVFGRLGTPSRSMDRIQIDARRILDHWLYVNRRRVVSIEKREDETPGDFASRADHAYADLFLGSQSDPDDSI